MAMATRGAKIMARGGRIKGVLIDLSGTLHVDNEVIPGCREALDKLREQKDVGVRFVTNSTTRTQAALVGELHRMGLPAVDPQHIVTAGAIVRRMLHTQHLRPLLLVDHAMHSEFDGINRENPNAVVVGLSPEHFHYDALNEAFRVLLNGGQLIALHEARYMAAQDGLTLGPGPFVKALEFASGVQAKIIGKPSAAFFHQALRDIHVAPQDAVMIGDDVRQDVGGANAIGMQSILVRTGKYRAGDEGAAGCHPTYVADDFADAIDWVLRQNLADTSASVAT